MENVNNKLLISFLITLIEVTFEFLSFNFNNYIYSVLALVLTILSLVFLIYIWYCCSEGFDDTLTKLLNHLISINAFALVTSVFIILYFVLTKYSKMDNILFYISSAFFCLQIVLLLLLTIINRNSGPLQTLFWVVCTSLAIILFFAAYFTLLYIKYFYNPNQTIKQLNN
uniref:Uncharacterized protein n=1 Tax=viral metagenome TaxID=1070528 RepID=A0A6C0DGP2_9ZZZZ